MTSTLKRSILATAVTTLMAAPAYATNGMNLEAFGAKAGGMGGASMAYDSGNSAMMNNPATLALRKDGNDFGLGVTVLMPDVKASMPGMPTAESGGDSYVMPSISYVRNAGKFAYGVGVLAQGGMGTEWAGSTFLSGGTGLAQRSEIGFARLMFPLAYQVNDDLAVAAQLDYVRATMDLKMIDQANGAYIQVSDNSDFNGKMTGDGWAFKLGAHYKINKEFAVGATYHSETDISDLKGSGTMTMLSGPGAGVEMPMNYRVVDFQWPETYAVGMAWNVNDKLMLAADIKRINWSKSMKSFNFGPEGMVGSMPQNWDDQTVFMIGGQYMITPTIALRAGYNVASNPVPADTLNPLFPAIVEQHYTAGIGWNIGGGHKLAASIAYSPEAEQTMTSMPVTITHSQFTVRANYNYHF